MDLLQLLAPSDSLVKKHLTRSLLSELTDRRTRSGFTLTQAVASGIQNPDSSIGIYAGDADSYRVFAPLLDPVIAEYHGDTGSHTVSDFTVPDLPDLDPEGRYILSTRVRLARNLSNYAFPCHICAAQRRKVEQEAASAFERLPKNLAGSYHPFKTCRASLLSQADTQKLIFGKGDRFQDAAGFNRDFPQSRGIFLSDDRRFIVWVNEEDHLRIISMDNSADLKQVFTRAGQGIQALSSRLDFAHDPARGFLTSCPTNIGTTMRAGVHIRLGKLEHNRPLLNRLVKEHHLQIRGTGGEKTRVDQAVFDISNRRRLGICESDLIQHLYTGLAAIIKAEQSL